MRIAETEDKEKEMQQREGRKGFATDAKIHSAPHRKSASPVGARRFNTYGRRGRRRQAAA